MQLVKPSFIIEGLSGNDHSLEFIGRVCYKSEEAIGSDTSTKFVKKILESGHESVIEHSLLSVRFVVDRGVSHELVRHRLMSFSQESTRYCNYKSGVTFIIPPWVAIEPGEYTAGTYASKGYDMDSADYDWYCAMGQAELDYAKLLGRGWTPQQARSVLPNSLKTEIVCSANFREWRHVLRLRTASAAHPQMREVMIPLLLELKTLRPNLFGDILCGE